MDNPRKSRNNARLWKPDAGKDLSLLTASFTTFSYDRHTHEQYAIGVIEHGVQQFVHKGNSHNAPTGTIISVNPDEVHDGQARTREGYGYRMAYLGLPYLRSLFGDDFGRNDFLAFTTPTTMDSSLAPQLSHALICIDKGHGDVDGLLSPILFRLFERHASPHMPVDASIPCDSAVRRALEFIHAHTNDTPNLDDIASRSGLSKYHLIREFKKQTGLTPHAYGLRHRVRLARKALEQGASPSEAALRTGFADQSHLTRRFKAIYGVTPGTFVRNI